MSLEEQRIRQYLLDMLVRINYLELIAEKGEDHYLKDVQSQAASERHFEVLGDIVKRLPSFWRLQHPLVAWSDIARFRDVLAHHYEVVNSQSVWRTIQEDLPVLKSHIESILRDLDHPS